MTGPFIAAASILIDASRDDVWKALTDPAAIKQYMFGTDVVSDWSEGGSIVWKGVWEGREYEDKGVILQVRPGRRLRYSHFSPLSGVADSPENYHNVTIELSAQPGGTRVSLTQDNNATQEEQAHSTKNWEMMLAELKKHLEG